MRKNSSLAGMLICCVIVAACSMVTGNRSAEQWLSLVRSGMIAEDNFRFSGSVVMGFEDGVALAPFAFQGEIEAHKQIALHAEQSSSFVHNPVNELEFIADHAEQSEIVYNGLDESKERNIVVLNVKLNEQAVTERWKDQLQQELNNVSLQAIASAKEEGKHLALVQQEADHAQRELEQMLQQLKVSAQYEITIDTVRAVELEMKELVNMNYMKDGAMIKEYRKSNITFDLTPDQVVR
ncbi:hypothetical protein J40TS1_00910 [Paenibacillus montaniterrae]|uniref:Band 7 domain-containing protein n=2 Tax=Paenibacillus montaniterrae TaxID=429341 RepID=A0A919YLM6_9BACL|nr:hypothetical protein J40TS1_00910 [Paenibacillus montaniterrae]